jgi:hypothetical protein
MQFQNCDLSSLVEDFLEKEVQDAIKALPSDKATRGQMVSLVYSSNFVGYYFFEMGEPSLSIKMMHTTLFYFNYLTKAGKKPYIDLIKLEPPNEGVRAPPNYYKARRIDGILCLSTTAIADS